MAQKIKARVLWFNENKGFGVLQCDSGRMFFAHYSDVVTRSENNKFISLKEKQTVHFIADSGNEIHSLLRARNIEVDKK